MADQLSNGSLVDTGSPYGIGRLVAVDSASARVQFFKGPAQNPYVTESFAKTDIAPATLMPHTRAYVFNGIQWKIGRIANQYSDEAGRYAVNFPKQEGAVLSASDFEIRWQQPVEDPFELLAVLGGDNPVIYRSRMDLIEQWHRQASAARGVESLFWRFAFARGVGL